MRLAIAVLTAAVVAAAALALLNRDPEPEAAAAPHVAIAPAVSSARPGGRVAGTEMSPQQAADAAIEDGKRPDLVPLPEAAFARPIARYRAYAERHARALRRAARRRDFDAAFDQWLLVGAAYGALGGLENRITGAIRAHDARRLSAAARALPSALRRAELTPVEFATRAHEILEDVQRDRLGDATGVRATADGVAATREVIATLHDVLAGRGDVLQTVDSRLTQLEGTLALIRRGRGGWPAPSALPDRLRQRLLGQLGAALEALAGVPGALETSLPPAIPALR